MFALLVFFCLCTHQPAHFSPVSSYDETVTLGDQRKQATDSPTSLANAEGSQHDWCTS
jgi:hypothetical protein